MVEDDILGKIMVKSNLKWFILVIVSVVFVVSIVTFLIYHKERKDSVSARKLNSPLPVKIVTVKKIELPYIIGATSISKEVTTEKVIAIIEAPVKAVKADLGDVIKVNQILVEYDGTVLLSQLKSAETNLNKASVTLDNSQINLKRMEDLFKAKLIAKVELENAQQTYAVAQSDYGNAKHNLNQVRYEVSYLRMKSPVKGIVLERSVNAGEIPPLKSPLFTVAITDPIFMIAKVSEQYVKDISLGQKAEVVFDAYPNLTYEGKIRKIDGNVDSQTRAFSAYIEIVNKNLQLKPGLTGFSRISVRKKALALPNLAIINPIGQRATVFVIDNKNIAHLREIQIETVTEKYTEIISGLTAGEKVVAVGMKELHDNDNVLIMDKIF